MDRLCGRFFVESPMQHRSEFRRIAATRGFVLVEVGAAAAVLAVVVVFLFVVAADGRRRAGLAASEENLHRFAAGTSAFGADNEERFWTFTWRKGESHSQWPDLNDADSDRQAHANQAVDIIRRRSDATFPRMPYWTADLSYSPLVLADYLAESLPSLMFASVADEQLLGWQENKEDAPGIRSPYSSSYELPTAFYDVSNAGSRIYQASIHNLFGIPGGNQLGSRSSADVAFPSQKVHMYDRYQRHFGPRVAYFAYEEARLPLLFADGHVDVRMSGDGNRGWMPNSPDSPDPTVYSYTPGGYEPDTLSGKGSDKVYGYLRWSRGGAGARDYGGPEVGPP
jgi:hypothetical protein